MAAETVEEPQDRPQQQPKKLHCVYTEQIAETCPIRVLLNVEEPSDDFSKYIASTNPAFKEVEGFLKTYMSALKPLLTQEFNQLSSFCHYCPLRIFYVEKHLKLV